ncbi:MAG: MarR family transcriptional regulator [Bacteroidota bacterium]
MPRRELGSYIDRTYKIVRQDLINRFKEEGVDLTPEQWVVVSKLKTDGKMYQTDLANLTFRDKPTVSRIVDLLVRKNMVARERDQKDGRKFFISLTHHGKKVVKKAYPAVEASRELGWTNLSEEEYTLLIKLLDKIFINYINDREN